MAGFSMFVLSIAITGITDGLYGQEQSSMWLKKGRPDSPSKSDCIITPLSFFVSSIQYNDLQGKTRHMYQSYLEHVKVSLKISDYPVDGRISRFKMRLLAVTMPSYLTIPACHRVKSSLMM